MCHERWCFLEHGSWENDIASRFICRLTNKLRSAPKDARCEQKQTKIRRSESMTTHVWLCNKKQVLMEQFELREIEYASWRASPHIAHCGDSPTNTWRVSRKNQPVSCCILSPRHSGSHSDSGPRKRMATTLNFLVPCAARVKHGPQTVDDHFYRIMMYHDFSIRGSNLLWSWWLVADLY